MRTGKTKSGFEFEINNDVLESWEFVELLAETEDNPLKSVALLKLLLGEKQANELKKHLGGKPKAAEMFNALTDIMNVLGDNAKN